jgi:hypothetical protein
LRVVVVKRVARFRDDAEQKAGGIAQDPPGVYELHALGPERFQAGDFGI